MRARIHKQVYIIQICQTFLYVYFLIRDYFFKLSRNISFVNHLSATVKFPMKITMKITRRNVAIYLLLSALHCTSPATCQNRKLEYLDWQCLTRNTRCSL